MGELKYPQMRLGVGFSLLLLIQGFFQPLDVIFLRLLREGFIRLRKRSILAELDMIKSAPFA